MGVSSPSARGAMGYSVETANSPLPVSGLFVCQAPCWQLRPPLTDAPWPLADGNDGFLQRLILSYTALPLKMRRAAYI